MNNFWQKDKIEHYRLATGSAFILNSILFIVFILIALFTPTVADVITLVLGILALLWWECLPNRAFSVGDLVAGTLGIFTGMILHKVVFAIGYYIIGM